MYIIPDGMSENTSEYVKIMRRGGIPVRVILINRPCKWYVISKVFFHMFFWFILSDAHAAVRIDIVCEKILQKARCSSSKLAGSKGHEILNQVCPQLPGGCQSIPNIHVSIRGLRLKFWCPIILTMSCNSGFPTQSSLDPPFSRQRSKCTIQGSNAILNKRVPIVSHDVCLRLMSEPWRDQSRLPGAPTTIQSSLRNNTSTPRKSEW